MMGSKLEVIRYNMYNVLCEHNNSIIYHLTAFLNIQKKKKKKTKKIQ